MSTTTDWKPPTPARLLWTDGTDVYIVESDDTVLALYERHTGDTYAAACDGTIDDWGVREGVIAVGFEDAASCLEQLQAANKAGLPMLECYVIKKSRGSYFLDGVRDDVSYQIEAQAEWWAQLPAGFLCSTEW